MKVSFRKVKNMAKANLFGPTVESTLEAGLMENSTGKDR